MENIMDEEEELRQRLVKIREDKERQKKEDEIRSIQDTYDRCKDSQYVKDVAEYPHWVTYRKISNPIIDWKDLGGCVKCTVHQEVRLTYRVMDDDNIRSKRRRVDVDVTIDDIERDRSHNFLQKDVPITEEEYNKALEQARTLLTLAGTFFGVEHNKS